MESSCVVKSFSTRSPLLSPLGEKAAVSDGSSVAQPCKGHMEKEDKSWLDWLCNGSPPAHLSLHRK